MTYRYFQPEPEYKIWYKKEQGRFFKKARLKAGLSVEDVARRTGIDIRLVESGKVNLWMRNVGFLIRLYHVPETSFIEWEQVVGIELKKLLPPRQLH